MLSLPILASVSCHISQTLCFRGCHTKPPSLRFRKSRYTQNLLFPLVSSPSSLPPGPICFLFYPRQTWGTVWEPRAIIETSSYNLSTYSHMYNSPSLPTFHTPKGGPVLQHEAFGSLGTLTWFKHHQYQRLEDVYLCFYLCRASQAWGTSHLWGLITLTLFQCWKVHCKLIPLGYVSQS